MYRTSSSCSIEISPCTERGKGPVDVATGTPGAAGKYVPSERTGDAGTWESLTAYSKKNERKMTLIGSEADHS